MEVTPELHLFDSKDAENVGWHDALAELIDNSLDAGATRVEIEHGGRRLSIKDDGLGVDDISALVRFGSHRRHKTTSLGQFGVGLKDAWCYLGPRMIVATVSHGAKTNLVIDRSDIKVVDGKWIAPDPVTEASTDAAGTTITFDPLKSGRGTPEKATLARLGWTFLPALESGRQIVFSSRGKRDLIAPCKLPHLQERVEASFDVGGKAVELIIGIMADGERNPHPSLWLCYGHRIVTNSAMGCGDYSAAKIAGIVRLGKGWKLTPHKNDLSEHADELSDAIYSAIEPMLKRASKMIEDIQSSQLRCTLERSINEALSRAKAKERRPGEHKTAGTKLPKATKRQRKQATVFDITAAGSVEVSGGSDEPKKVRGIKLDWCNIDPDRIGEYDPTGNVVMLNDDNAFIAHAKKQDNQEALRSVAIGLVCHHCSVNEGRQKLLVERGDFIANWGSVMSSISFNGKGNGNGK